jgi:membrane protein YdbS with pleckstrin-like domain
VSERQDDMNKAQKAAWFTLIVLATAWGLSLAAFCMGYFVVGVPAKRAAAGFGFMGLLGLLGLIPILFRKDRDKVQCDERDMMIQRNAGLAAYATFWVLFVAATMIPWFVKGPGGTITVNYLPWMVLGGFCAVMLVQALVTLQQYGWTGQEASHE